MSTWLYLTSFSTQHCTGIANHRLITFRQADMHDEHNDGNQSTTPGIRHAHGHDFDRVIDRRATSSSKWNKYDRDVLPFWVADMDFEAPGFILDRIRRRIDHGILGYTETPPELIDAALAWLRTSFGWDVSPLWLVWLPGVVPGFNLACRVAGSPGDSVMMNVPVYHPFLSAPGHGGRRSIEVPLAVSGNEWVMDFDAMAAAASNDTRLFMLCNPQNPTGRVYRLDELEALADFALRRDMLICTDEIHCSLLLGEHQQHIPIAALSKDIEARTITLMAPTKSYNTPGLSCGFAVIADAGLRRRYIEARAGLLPGIGPLAYLAAQAAYEDNSDWLPSLRRYLTDNRDLLESSVAQLPGVSMTHVEATYLAWLDVRELPVESVPRHFESHGIGLSDGNQFRGPGYMRFNFGCPRNTLEQGIARLQAAVAAL
jgi:cystathionine beta-lyase